MQEIKTSELTIIEQLKEMRDEEWRPIAGFNQYEISSYGRIRRIRYGRMRIFKKQFFKTGYERIDLCQSGKKTTTLVHLLVLSNFSGPRKEGQQCRHLDGNRKNNHISNLKWGSRQENADDRVIHGTNRSGENHPRSKLTWKQVDEIRATFKPTKRGERSAFVLFGEKYGVARTVIQDIIYGNIWIKKSNLLNAKEGQ